MLGGCSPSLGRGHHFRLPEQSPCGTGFCHPASRTVARSGPTQYSVNRQFTRNDFERLHPPRSEKEPIRVRWRDRTTPKCLPESQQTFLQGRQTPGCSRSRYKVKGHPSSRRGSPKFHTAGAFPHSTTEPGMGRHRRSRCADRADAHSVSGLRRGVRP